MNKVKTLCGFLIFATVLIVVGCSKNTAEKNSDQEDKQTESVPAEDSPEEQIPKRTQAAQEQIAAVVNAVQNGQITEERIEESVLRILQLKYDQGLIS